MSPAAPNAPKRPVELTHHGDTRIDEWYWLRERENPEVLAYLEAENEFTDAELAHLGPLRQRLFEEIKSRIKETDLSPPVKKDDYWYYSRTVEGLQYAIHCRRHGSVEAPEQVLLDENELAADREFFSLGVFDVSPSHRLLAYSTDFEGDEVYTLKVRDLDAGKELVDEIPGTYYGLAWGDDEHLFYTTVNESMRPWRVHRHRLGSDVADDVVVFEEPDEAFYVGVTRSKSDGYVFVYLESKVTSEVHFLPATDPTGEFTVVEPRRQGVEYSVDHHGDHFLIVTNDEAPNFKLMTAPVSSPGRANWVDAVPHRDGVRLEEVEPFRGHLVLQERADALVALRVIPLEGDVTKLGEPRVIAQPESVYAAAIGANAEMDSTVLRFGYTSLVTPRSVIDYDMDTGERTLVKQDEVLGGFDSGDYETTRLWATAPDGVRVPMSLLYRKGTPQDGTAPALLYGYGAYEASIDPLFSSVRLSLVDRGFVFAIAHVRGGGEMGRAWYEDGKLLHKKNTFTDFIACGEHLVKEGWTSPDRLVIRGGSAGGLLMGAVTNMRPDLWRAVVAEVPFVDALTTILDETLPLTVMEWEEWGNPVDDPEVYFYMKSYSPYDNVAAKDYPTILARSGLNDPRVSYWEPAKWVAKLRDRKTDANRLVLRTDMGAGHMGPSGRYDAWKDEAFIQSFILDAVGLSEL